jgi:hypothetical protein
MDKGEKEIVAALDEQNSDRYDQGYEEVVLAIEEARSRFDKEFLERAPKPTDKDKKQCWKDIMVCAHTNAMAYQIYASLERMISMQKLAIYKHTQLLQFRFKNENMEAYIKEFFTILAEINRNDIVKKMLGLYETEVKKDKLDNNKNPSFKQYLKNYCNRILRHELNDAFNERYDEDRETINHVQIWIDQLISKLDEDYSAFDAYNFLTSVSSNMEGYETIDPKARFPAISTTVLDQIYLILDTGKADKKQVVTVKTHEHRRQFLSDIQNKEKMVLITDIVGALMHRYHRLTDLYKVLLSPQMFEILRVHITLMFEVCTDDSPEITRERNPEFFPPRKKKKLEIKKAFKYLSLSLATSLVNLIRNEPWTPPKPKGETSKAKEIRKKNDRDILQDMLFLSVEYLPNVIVRSIQKSGYEEDTDSLAQILRKDVEVAERQKCALECEKIVNSLIPYIIQIYIFSWHTMTQEEDFERVMKRILRKKAEIDLSIAQKLFQSTSKEEFDAYVIKKFDDPRFEEPKDEQVVNLYNEVLNYHVKEKIKECRKALAAFKARQQDEKDRYASLQSELKDIDLYLADKAVNEGENTDAYVQKLLQQQLQLKGEFSESRDRQNTYENFITTLHQTLRNHAAASEDSALINSKEGNIGYYLKMSTITRNGALLDFITPKEKSKLTWYNLFHKDIEHKINKQNVLKGAKSSDSDKKGDDERGIIRLMSFTGQRFISYGAIVEHVTALFDFYHSEGFSYHEHMQNALQQDLKLIMRLSVLPEKK